MTLLNSFLSNINRVDIFYPRKLQLPLNESFILTGVRGSGKSALIIDYINSQKKRFLYLDCQDPAFILEDIDIVELNNFIKSENIRLLVLDHYFEGFLEELPKVEQLIIVSRENLDINLPTYKLYPLDFEEFLNFKKSINITNAFNLYTKFGSLPRIAKSTNPTISSREIFFEKFDEQEGKVILILSLFQAKIATPHQIYQRAKESFKISKDWLYKSIKNFENEGVLYQLPTLDKGFGKKIILFDFIFSKYLNKYQQIYTTFDALVALALIKHKFNPIATTAPLGYLLDDSFIQIAPFTIESEFWKKAYEGFNFYANLGIKEVIILTVNLQYEFKIKDINFKAISFYEWVVGLG